MSVSYFVRYRGTPRDAEAFLAHYREQHAAIMRQYPGIRGCRLHHPVEWNDPVPVVRDEVYLIAELIFDTVEDLDHALQSEVRQRSRADFVNFPPLDGDVRHLAVSTETLF